jgi:hypothetical protein
MAGGLTKSELDALIADYLQPAAKLDTPATGRVQGRTEVGRLVWRAWLL